MKTLLAIAIASLISAGSAFAGLGQQAGASATAFCGLTGTKAFASQSSALAGIAAGATASASEIRR